MRIRTILQAEDGSLGAQVNLTAKAFTAALAARLPEGLTTTQVAVLAYLSRHPGSAQSQIAAGTGVDTATLAELLKRLDRRGHVRREPDPKDARRLLVSPGELPDDLLTNGLHAAAEVNALATKGFTASERAAAHALLARVRANLSTACPPHGSPSTPQEVR